jgi:hypothetical protein
MREASARTQDSLLASATVDRMGLWHELHIDDGVLCDDR